MNSKEYILCAALHYDDKKQYPNQCKNIESGYIITGRRHHNCFTTLYILLGLGNYDKNLITSGFITNLDRFLDREEAYIIAKEADQLLYSKNDPYLFSEDLY